MSAPARWVRTSAITASTDASSFQAGMKTRVRKEGDCSMGARPEEGRTQSERIVLETPHGKRRRPDSAVAARNSTLRYAPLADRRLRGGQLHHGRDRLHLWRQPAG